VLPVIIRMDQRFDCPEWHGFPGFTMPSWLLCGERNRQSNLMKTCCLRSRRLSENRVSRTPFARAIRTESSLLLIVEVFQRPSKQSKHLVEQIPTQS
jgi:hypothetical protein